MHTSKCSFSEGFFPVLIWGYFLFHHSPQWAPKYHFAEHKIKEFANCSKKGTVELCVMKSHIRKQCLRKLLSSYFRRILPFSPWATMGSANLTLQITRKECYQTASWELRCNSVRGIQRSERSFSENLFTFWTDDISFISVGLNAIQNIPSQVPQ